MHIQISFLLMHGYGLGYGLVSLIVFLRNLRKTDFFIVFNTLIWPISIVYFIVRYFAVVLLHYNKNAITMIKLAIISHLLPNFLIQIAN